MVYIDYVIHVHNVMCSQGCFRNHALYDKRIYSAKKFGVHFLPSIRAVPRRTKMHLNGIPLIETEFCKIIDHFVAASNLLVKLTLFSFLRRGSKDCRNSHFPRLQT